MKHGFVKLAAAVPEILVAAPTKNVPAITALIDRAYAENVDVLVFPELCVTGATCGDLFFTDSLIENAERALKDIIRHTAGKKMLVFVGVPVRANGKIYNCAAAISDGHRRGTVAKTHLTDDERRWFSPDDGSLGMNLFQDSQMSSLLVACEIGEDIDAPVSPSVTHAMNGATVIVNLSAARETVGSEDYRRALVNGTSGKLIAAYVSANAGESESTTDTVCSGHLMISANGKMLAENPPFGGRDLITAVVDLEHLAYDRRRREAWKTNVIDHATLGHSIGSFVLEKRETDLTGVIDPHPFIPSGEENRKKTLGRILDIQSRGLAKRIRAAYAKTCVIALSGGLDSTLALIVTARAMDILGRPHSDITAVTLPCFGTTSRTRSNAESMAVEFGTSFRAIDIKEAVDIHFRDIGHDPEDHSVVYENSQARERTQIIMDIANAENGLVIGTGDLSELALGWATYNGDHMSNYGVNGGIPKTLVRHLVSYYAEECDANGKPELARVLRDVLATPVSPELLPAKDGEIAQKTEDIVGPYDLHDFFLYHFVRYGETPDKIFREAKAAFDGEFDDETIKKWLNTFLRRFYSQQFKRSALPDGPKVGSVALSPRGDWRMPSDACGWEMKLD